MVPIGTVEPAPSDENQTRLLDGLAKAIAEKGYAATTIADIVRHARVSKRTFYENFADKEACFLASYRAVTERLMTTITYAVDANGAWQQQLDAAARAYLHLLEENPALTQTFLVEIHAAGPKASSCAARCTNSSPSCSAAWSTPVAASTPRSGRSLR